MSKRIPHLPETWFTVYWRPALGWQYVFICLFDFFLAPVFLTLYCYITHTPYIKWEPLTLQGGAFYHMAMGAVTGVSAWSRGREKIAAIEGHTRITTEKEVTTGVRRQGDDG